MELSEKIMAERRAYYEVCPRGFANEYDVYVVPASLVGRFEAAFPGARRLTRREAIRWGVTRPREARRDGEQWFGGLVSGGIYARTERVADLLTAAAVSTAQAIRDAESYQ